ncbi:hypothetical protein ZIOFF_000690 [Zingiber officinale]|uniref:Uncharacterized protein n=1 Tax=Zingiber officinale TaxID=94328 RepID=A0A8J5M7V9_ZINOF|nr:hypothetical protein ZIOFF_000690 [Zingiber officinale]
MYRLHTFSMSLIDFILLTQVLRDIGIEVRRHPVRCGQQKLSKEEEVTSSKAAKASPRTNVPSMVDVHRRMAALSPSHAAGLRRLSVRAATASHAAATHRLGILSLRPIAEGVLSHLRAASVPLCPGLSEPELACLEADLAFSIPPDLRALLALGIPSGPGFPDWRAPGPGRLLCLPRAAAAFQVACGTLWPRSWGSRPADPARALRRARAALRRAPLLLPLFGRCYIPCLPALAGNPVFYVDDSRVFCCALDFADFFQRHWPTSPHADFSCPLPSLDACRWIEFWSDAASDRRRRSSSSSSSSSASDAVSSSSSPSSPPDPERFVEIRTPRLPDWVGGYLDGIGSVLRQGGWGECDIREMVHVPASRVFDSGDQPDTSFAIDAEVVLDALLVKAGWCSDSLRLAGWSSDDISDALDLNLLRPRGRERCSPVVKLPPAVALKLEKLVGHDTERSGSASVVGSSKRPGASVRRRGRLVLAESRLEEEAAFGDEKSSVEDDGGVAQS